ncbi:hypothetical protein CC79DRAFT_1363967 [Sarocladium strictum]
MVGRRRTESCETCRKRRVKCDEVRPVCGQCAKKGRACSESPPQALIWVKRGQQSKDTQAIVVLEHESTEPDETERRNPITSLNLVQAKEMRHGAKFQSFRLTRKPPLEEAAPRQSPAMSNEDMLRSKFIRAYQDAPCGYNLSFWGSRYSCLPRYLGKSEVLDAAVTCLLEVHAGLVRGDHGPQRLIQVTYNRALSLMQQGLRECSPASRATTLCAISMLAWAEGFSRNTPNLNYITHQAGISTFIEHYGLSCAEDELGRAVVYSSGGAIFMIAVLKGKDDFMQDSSWRSITVARKYETCPFQRLHNRTTWHLHQISTIVQDIRSLSAQEPRKEEAEDLIGRCLDLKASAANILVRLDTLLQSEPGRISSTASDDETCPQELKYWFMDHTTSITATYVWTLIIYINSLLATIGRYLPSGRSSQWSESTQLNAQAESHKLATNILMTVEYAKSLAPLGSSFMNFPMVIAWGVMGPGLKDWALRSLNEMTQDLLIPHTPWLLGSMVSVFTGASLSLEDIIEKAQQDMSG